MTFDRLGPLLLDLYSCPTERGRWPIVLDQVCRAMGARSAVVQLLVVDGQRATSRWMVRDSRSEDASDLHDRYLSDAVNPRMQPQRMPSRRPLAIVRDSDLFDADDARYADLQKRLAAVRLGSFVSVRIALPNEATLALVLHRNFGDSRDFAGAEEQFALAFMPHLRQAVQLATAVRDAREHARDLSDALNNIRTALVVCDEDAQVRWMNRSAEQILAREDSVWLRGGRLTAASAQLTCHLRRIVSATARSAADGQFLVLDGRTRIGALQLRVQRIIEDTDPVGCMHDIRAPRGRVLIILSDPGAPATLPADLIGRIFALSPAESRLAAALCRGLSLNEYAMENGVSIGTARCQLKQVMAKTHVGRQSHLIQRLYSSVIAQSLIQVDGDKLM